jgi:uncharacterized protein (TIGR04255 family)
VRPTDLPDFENPPINEVVLSLQFATLENLKSFHIGLLWERFKADYPDVIERTPIAPVFETFGSPMSSMSRPFSVHFEQIFSPPLPRYWFESSGGPDLLQIQQDRIIHNWRKREDEPIYPRYETLRERFEAELNKFEDWLTLEKIGELRPNQCEVTYLNVIQMPGSERVHHRLEQITTLWSGRLSAPLTSELESVTAQVRFKLVDEGKPVGRVHVSMQPALLQADPSKEVVKLDITARGRPKNQTVKSAFDFFDFGRAAVVRTFAAVTTPMMHQMWGRKDGSYQPPIR